MNILPINLDDLIHARGIESERREFKKTWNEQTRAAVVRSICAFANDLHNLNGGYIIIGIEDTEGKPILPPEGLDAHDVDLIQREIAGDCRQKIMPDFLPLVSPEEYLEKTILIIWAPAGETRPYQAPKRSGQGRGYFVRVGSATIEAEGDILRQLLEIAPKTPFDDRRRHELSVSEVSGNLVRKFLSDIRSSLVNPGVDLSTEELTRAIRITARIDGSEVPRNVALLMFCDTPSRHFPYARIEVAHFGDDAGGNLVEEKLFPGTLEQQLRTAIDYVNTISTVHLKKVPGQPEVQRFVSYPYQAVEEALVNAVIHRSYEAPPEPIKVYFYPDRLEITSYPGPVQGFDKRHLQPGAHLPPPPARNRRIGEFFKELRLAELRGTGIPKIRRDMLENGSPEPQFDFDDARTYFRVTLPAHPGYIVLHAIRESAQLWHTGDRDRAISHLIEARSKIPQSGVLAGQLIEYAAAVGDMSLARRALAELEQTINATDRHVAYLALARAYIDSDKPNDARTLLDNVPIPAAAPEAVEVAILHKRSGKLESAHKIFSSIARDIQNDPKALHEFAQTKIKLASQVRPRRPADQDTKKRLNREAAELLRRVVSLAPDQPTRLAWAWFDLAKTMAWLREPETEIRKACEKAIEIEPTESRFRDWLSERINKNRRSNQQPR